MTTRLLKRPLKRRLDVKDRHGRSYYIEIEPNGTISVWLSRLKRELTTIQSVYQRAVVQRSAAEAANKRKAKT